MSGCTNAINDKVMRLISSLKYLEFLDISYCKRVTDQGLVHYSDKKLPITVLSVSGVNGASSLGLG